MAGTIVSKYRCDLHAWKSFEIKLKAMTLYIEMQGSLDTHIFYDIKEAKDGPHGIYLTAKYDHTHQLNNSIDVKLDWIIRNAGTKPLSSFNIAIQIERLILECGGVCYHAPVEHWQKTLVGK
jgi:hypothetical protein